MHFEKLHVNSTLMYWVVLIFLSSFARRERIYLFLNPRDFS